MYQLQVTIVGPQLPQAFDQPEVESTATVHRETRGLVDDQQAWVFIHNPSLDFTGPVAGHNRRCAGLRLMQRRNPQQIPCHQPVLRLHPSLVDAELTLAQPPVDTGFRYALELAQQVIVEALPRAVGVDLYEADSTWGACGACFNHEIGKSPNN